MDGWIDRKAVFTKFVLFKPWSQQNPLLFLKIQTSNKIIWFEMHRTHQRTPRRLSLFQCFGNFAFMKSTHRFLRFFALSQSSLNKISMTWSVIAPVSLLSCYIPLTINAPGWQIFELLPQRFPQKQVNMWTTESSCSGFDVTSGPRPMLRLTRSRTKMAAFWHTLTGHKNSRI